MKIFIMSCIFLLVSTGCTTVTLSPDGAGKLATTPDFEESQHFFIFGLVGDRVLEIDEVCDDAGARQLQTQDRIQDQLLGILTLGIYMPRTAKIWCNN